MESLQLSAVVMYFHWATSPHNTGKANSDNASEYGLGVDSFSAATMLWDYGDGEERSYYIAASVACLLVMLWTVLVSVPMVKYIHVVIQIVLRKTNDIVFICFHFWY